MRFPNLSLVYLWLLIILFCATCLAKVTDPCGGNTSLQCGKDERCITQQNSGSPDTETNNPGICLCMPRFVATKERNCVPEAELQEEDLHEDELDPGEHRNPHSENMHEIILLIAGVTTVVVIGFVYVIARLYLRWRRLKHGKRH